MNFDFPVYRNPLKTRADAMRSLEELLAPLSAHAAPDGYHLGSASALYPPRIARMEGWSRCLWGIAPFVAGNGTWPGMDALLETLSRGLDPDDPAYWGDCGPRDQRLVEMAAIAFALLLAPQVFWEALDKRTQQNLYRWLSLIETRELPPMNWHYFRLMVQAAFRSLGLKVHEEAEKESFKVLENCYRGEGWYQDGPGGGFDLYNPFGFHFYNLVLVSLADRGHENTGPIHDFAERFRERANTFGVSYAAWFYRDGGKIPHGRSLSYRFAESSFFSACAFAGLEVLSWPVIKGLVLRNLRRWFARPILDSGGLLSVGYGYPNLIMADAYNSPGSPYWALKTYLFLALKNDHPFWQAEEAPLPFPKEGQQSFTITCREPKFIISNSNTDAQLLSAGHSAGFDMNHMEQKYGKFAYSARFGFCVALGSMNIEKTGCDSTLLLSEGDGYWRGRRQVKEEEAGENWLKSRWQPWPGVDIVTVLIRLGDWHIRIHRITGGRTLQSVEGGFSIPRCRGDETMPASSAAAGPRSLVLYPWAASRIEALENALPRKLRAASSRSGAVVNPAPNLNVLHPLTAIPVLEGRIEPGTGFLACAVWAGDGTDTDRASGGNPPELMAEKKGRNYRFVVSKDHDRVAVDINILI
jgi:hypothetical protein